MVVSLWFLFLTLTPHGRQGRTQKELNPFNAYWCQAPHSVTSPPSRPFILTIMLKWVPPALTSSLDCKLLVCCGDGWVVFMHKDKRLKK